MHEVHDFSYVELRVNDFINRLNLTAVLFQRRYEPHVNFSSHFPRKRLRVKRVPAVSFLTAWLVVLHTILQYSLCEGLSILVTARSSYRACAAS